MGIEISGIKVRRQPTDTSCGATCLHALYRFYGRRANLEDLIQEVPESPEGGTQSVFLACHALQLGFSAVTYSYNLRIFDPTWSELTSVELLSRLEAREQILDNDKLRASHQAYIKFLKMGGSIRMDDLSPALLEHLLGQGGPVIAGLTSTYLYNESRMTEGSRPDDVKGSAEGHFVIVVGYEAATQRVILADPYHPNRLSEKEQYSVSVFRFINSVMLGVLTYDANLLIIKPRK